MNDIYKKMIDIEAKIINRKIEQNDSIESLYFIRDEINKYFGIKIIDKTRKRESVHAKQMAMYFSVKYTTIPFQKIGMILCDYSFNCAYQGVRHSIENVENQLQYTRFYNDFIYLDNIFKKEFEKDKYKHAKSIKLINILQHRISAIQMCNVGTLEDYIIGIFRKRIEKLEKFK